MRELMEGQNQGLYLDQTPDQWIHDQWLVLRVSCLKLQQSQKALAASCALVGGQGVVCHQLSLTLKLLDRCTCEKSGSNVIQGFSLVWGLQSLFEEQIQVAFKKCRCQIIDLQSVGVTHLGVDNMSNDEKLSKQHMNIVIISNVLH